MLFNSPQEIHINMASTFDGRISLPADEWKKIRSPLDRIHMDMLRACFDAVISGTKSIEIDNPRFDVSYVKEGDAFNFPWFDSLTYEKIKLRTTPLSVILCKNTIPTADKRIYDNPQGVLLIVEPNATKNMKIRYASVADNHPSMSKHSFVQKVWYQKLVEQKDTLSLNHFMIGTRIFPVIFIEENPKAEAIQSILVGLGLNHTLVEGGSIMNSFFLDADIVDAVHLTILPFMANHTENSFNGNSIDRILRWNLADLYKGDQDELFLYYRKES